MRFEGGGGGGEEEGVNWGEKLELGKRREFLNFEPPFNSRPSKYSQEALMNWRRKKILENFQRSFLAP